MLSSICLDFWFLNLRSQKAFVCFGSLSPLFSYQTLQWFLCCMKSDVNYRECLRCKRNLQYVQFWKKTFHSCVPVQNVAFELWEKKNSFPHKCLDDRVYLKVVISLYFTFYNVLQEVAAMICSSCCAAVFMEWSGQAWILNRSFLQRCLSDGITVSCKARRCFVVCFS